MRGIKNESRNTIQEALKHSGEKILVQTEVVAENIINSDNDIFDDKKLNLLIDQIWQCENKKSIKDALRLWHEQFDE